MKMNRNGFQQFAELRLREAEKLLEAEMYSGAYYLAGYAVECALKACIAKKSKEHDFPPPRKMINDIYTHDFDKLISSAGLERIIKDANIKNRALSAYWAIVKEWNEESRYREIDKTKAENLISAINDKSNGVLSWLKQHW